MIEPIRPRVFVVFGVTQDLADTDALQRRTSVDARVHAQVVLGVDLVKIDDAAFVENAQMHNLASQFVDAPHAGFRLAEDVHVGQGWSAQPSQRPWHPAPYSRGHDLRLQPDLWRRPTQCRGLSRLNPSIRLSWTMSSPSALIASATPCIGCGATRASAANMCVIDASAGGALTPQL